MDDELILKNNLKKARTEKGYSQAALAKEIGVSRNTISSIETPIQPHSQTGSDFMHRP